ncbi:chromosome segregation protein SMC [Pseudoprimorskyibacter insulae]|uniref:Chromosome partition protein Smc n=1 Tax=Pseudoprimorskyibacter insulae TaxID=1695997 RepID=A0A2R8B0R6_9RHOB|nr:chromosome segregation protein SMC [Pseudoprimorskyibacter insulae]SPF81861.1 hypothetical protein PRI8871_03687 [Pseudoprimorskyibacter insulae]
MKLRAIELTNVRRFTGTVRIDGITDGLNVLSEPNETGKSTIFDALQAVFFKAHGSSDKVMKALRPHAGGAPEISVEVETSDGHFKISKRWFQKPAATVHQGDRLIAQSDAAEDWIARSLGQSIDGPAGLIWVRQGMTALSDGSKSEQSDALEARRDLMSSVGEEVEAMTGGRRMDAALRRCKDELAEYTTSTGRPKAGGAWKDALDLVEALTTKRNQLTAKTADLHEALKARNAQRRTLKDLTDADAVATRSKRLEAAQKAHAEATRHAEDVEKHTRAVEMAELKAEASRTRLDDLRKATKEAATAQQQVAEKTRAAEQARKALDDKTKAQDAAQDTLAKASATLEACEAALARAQAAKAAKDSAARREELTKQIEQAETARKDMEAAKAGVRGLTDDRLTKLERLSANHAAAQMARDAGAAQLRVTYTGDRRMQVSGGDLAEGAAIPIIRPMQIDIAGVGQIDIRPPASDRADPVEAAQQALRNALSEAGVATLDAARAQAAARNTAERRHAEAAAKLSGLAPDGIEALRVKLADLPAQVDAEDAPDLETAASDADRARKAEKSAQTAFSVAKDTTAEARNDLVRAETHLTQATQAQAKAAATLAATGDDEAALLDTSEIDRKDLQTWKETLSSIKAAAPDLAGAKAALDHAQSVVDSANAQISQLEKTLVQLDERISHAAGDAVEERLAETEEKLTLAAEDLARIEHEVRVLTRLQTALSEARAQARERYFAPVAQALKPLLSLLWPEAELDWSEDSLLPDGLIRDGQKEPLDILSGGTQEQIALLVRLAFARMLADAGRAAPIILDDALVYTDDDRIERMFVALHRQASDLQILVLTCRQRAFRDLGGQMLTLTR